MPNFFHHGLFMNFASHGCHCHGEGKHLMADHTYTTQNCIALQIAIELYRYLPPLPSPLPPSLAVTCSEGEHVVVGASFRLENTASSPTATPDADSEGNCTFRRTNTRSVAENGVDWTLDGKLFGFQM